MGRVMVVEQFLSAPERKEDRKRLIYQVRAGSSTTAIMQELEAMGESFSLPTVRNWTKSVQFKVGIEAERINDINADYSGLLPESLLTALVGLMHTSLNQLILEFNRRSLSQDDENPISTKDLGTIISNFSARIIAATSEANKIKAVIDYRSTVEAILEELRLETEATYSKNSPESIPIVENIIEQVREKLELDN